MSIFIGKLTVYSADPTLELKPWLARVWSWNLEFRNKTALKAFEHYLLMAKNNPAHPWYMSKIDFHWDENFAREWIES